MTYRLILIVVICGMSGIPASGFAFSLPGILSAIVTVDSSEQHRHYQRVQDRVSAWKALIAESENSSDRQKLSKVNRFFNRIDFVEDKVQWGVEDYWASPREFLRQNAGDCEDYAIAKYFTLKAMGVSEDRLRITYVSMLPSGQAHMVLVYLENESKTALVLDNMQGEIEAFVERQDLDPVYSFNRNGLWIANRDSAKDEIVAGGVGQIRHWQALTAKMAGERTL